MRSPLLDDLVYNHTPACDLADHAVQPRAVERRRRNDAVVRNAWPQGARTPPCRRHDGQAAALGAALLPVTAGDRDRSVGRVQVLEGQHRRLVTRSRESPTPSPPRIAVAAILRANPPTALGQWNIHVARSGARIVRVEANQT